MRNQGLSDPQIIENLRRENFSNRDISEALELADVGYNNLGPQENLDFPNPPSPSEQEQQFDGAQYPKEQEFSEEFIPRPRESLENMQEIVESIVREKLEEAMQDFGNIVVWKNTVENNIMSIKQEILRTQERLENIQGAILEKVSDYNKNIISINTEMKSLEKVFERILSPLVSNIKELDKITKELKKNK